MGLRVVNQLDIDKWKEFVTAHPCGNIFHTPEMFQVYTLARGYKPLLWAIVDEEENLQALHLPIQVTLRGGILRYISTRNINYGSILATDTEVGKKALSMVLEKYNQQVSRVPLITQLRHVSCLDHFREIFQHNGYEYEPHLNYHIKLDRNPNDILQSFGKQTRRKIRVNIRKGNVIIKEITNPGMMPQFYEILKKTYSHARVPLADISLFEAAYKVLKPKQMVRFTIAFVEGEPASTIICLLYKDVIYGWYMGLNRYFGKYYPNEFVIWETLEWGSTNGFRVLDFGGAGHPDEKSGVRKFKLKFRGHLVEFGRHNRVHAPVRYKICEVIYEMSRNVLLLLSKVSKKRAKRNFKRPSVDL